MGAQIELANPLFLIGKNGAGKSNFLSALEFISDCMVLPLHAVFERHGGINAVRYRTGGKSRPGNFGLRVDFSFGNGAPHDGWYAFEIRAREGYEFEVLREKCVVRTDDETAWFDRTGEGLTTSDATIKPLVDKQALVLPLVGGADPFVTVTKGLGGIRIFSVQPKQVQELQDPDPGTSLKSDGSNLASVLKVLEKESLQELWELVGTVVPGLSSVRPIRHGKKLSLEFMQEWEEGDRKRSTKHEAFAMSDGTLRILGLLAIFLQRNRPRLVGLEEPESTIHPEALSVVLEQIRSFSKETQIVVSTHSPDVLDAKWIGPENIRLVTWQYGVTHLLPPNAATSQMIKDHLAGAGELLRSSALQPESSNLFVAQEEQLELFE